MPEDVNESINSRVAAQPYHRPAIVHELTLETRAGSPLIIDPSIDPLGLDPTIQ